MTRPIFLFLFLLPFLGTAQRNPALYDTDWPGKEFHKGRREALRELLPKGAVAVFFSAPEQKRSNDVYYLYHQDPDFFYLNGLREPNACLILFKDFQDIGGQSVGEVLFMQGKNPFMERWTGVRMGTDSAKVFLGINAVKTGQDFPDFKIDFSKFSKVLWQNKFPGLEDDPADRGDLFSLVKHFRIKTEISGAKVDSLNLRHLMAELREIKTPEELVLLRKAIKITCDALRELMKALEGGWTEYQAQALVEYLFRKNGAEYPGYPSIVGGGENSCILHYNTNRKRLVKNDLLVVDAGAEYHMYTADVTRTLPVNGKFTPEQKIIYNIVLEAQNAGIKASKAGNDFREPHKVAFDIIANRLLELGIIKEKTQALRYFFHGTSHYLGLDVHDPGLYGKLQPNSVITVEPGIYIAAGSDCDPKWWNIGVRIEDDVLITAGEPEVLSSFVPKTIEEIEKLMKEESLFNLIR
jgi:Xaa-Pro aminopeptidase